MSRRRRRSGTPLTPSNDRSVRVAIRRASRRTPSSRASASLVNASRARSCDGRIASNRTLRTNSGVAWRRGFQRLCAPVGQRDDGASPIVVATASLHEAAGPHPGQLMRQPAFAPAEFIPELLIGPRRVRRGRRESRSRRVTVRNRLAADGSSRRAAGCPSPGSSARSSARRQ